MRRAAAGLALLLLWAAAGPARADDYPFSGFFNVGFEDESFDDTQLSCAHGFFRQDRDGTFVNYHLDAAGYDRDGAIRYVQYGRGTCSLIDDGRIESCKMTFSTEPGEFGAVFVDIVRSIEPDLITLAFADDVEQARTILAGDEPMPGNSFFIRCPGFTDAALDGYLTTGTSRLESADRDAVLSPELDDETRARLASIRDRLLETP